MLVLLPTQQLGALGFKRCCSSHEHMKLIVHQMLASVRPKTASYMCASSLGVLPANTKLAAAISHPGTTTSLIVYHMLPWVRPETAA